jgi:hypothetical protein
LIFYIGESQLCFFADEAKRNLEEKNEYWKKKILDGFFSFFFQQVFAYAEEAQFQNRVARWYIFKPKIPIWIIFLIGRCRYNLWTFGLFYGQLVYFIASLYTYFVVIWFIFLHFGMLYQEKSGNPDPGKILESFHRSLKGLFDITKH